MNLGIKPEEAQGFANAASEHIGGFLSDHYTNAQNGNVDWNAYEWYGSNGDNDWYDFHINQTNKYVDPVFNELAQNYIIENTGLFPNSQDNILGKDTTFGQYTRSAGNVTGFTINSGLSGDWGFAKDFANTDNWTGHYSSNFYEDTTGDGYADSFGSGAANVFDIRQP